MNRRSFVKYGYRGLAFAPVAAAVVPLIDTLQAQAIPAGVLERIGITTVCFRNQFAATRPQNAAGTAPALTLLDAPRYIADQLGIHNVEVWNRHFDDMSLDYCRQLKAAAAAAGSRITNIQLDGQYDLSAADDTQRMQSIALVKGWMDRAAAVGAPRMRANPGGRPGDPIPDRVIDSFTQLATYGRTINVKILVENHTGLSQPIPGCVEIVRRVNDPFCRALSDWGNSPSDSQEARVKGLSAQFPYLEFISAKEVDFDQNNRHISYDIVPIIRATEASGYRGIYSIEFFGQQQPPDVVAAAKGMMQVLAANIRA